MSYRTKSLALSAVLAALALIFSYVEAMIPPIIPMPGVKLGIANLVIIVALYSIDFKHAFSINIVRILVAGLLFSGLFGMLYSLAGGVLSIIVMGLLKKTDLFSIVGVSMAGGVTHNLGQLIVAALIVENQKMFLYFPILLFSGLVTGILIGIAAHLINNNVSSLKEKVH
ncbi:MAG: Gx transporter family protein [Clostridia bacterium]|nr:Gx transporter family protein [Clostridia bacterium]